jgi:hypothetical protein
MSMPRAWASADQRVIVDGRGPAQCGLACGSRCLITAGLRLVRGQFNRLIEQRLVGNHPVRLDAAGRADDRRGRASSMRVASSLAANPPNTTEWIAPMRAQASIAIAASGIIGM